MEDIPIESSHKAFKEVDCKSTIEERLKNLEEQVKTLTQLVTKNVNVVEGTISFDVVGKGIKVSGDTKMYKDNLKTLGAKWNPSLKSWILSPIKAKCVIKFFELVEGVNVIVSEEATEILK
jgi:hypothetical protein